MQRPCLLFISDRKLLVGLVQLSELAGEPPVLLLAGGLRILLVPAVGGQKAAAGRTVPAAAAAAVPSPAQPLHQAFHSLLYLRGSTTE
jgi:hypothetical protein